MDDYLRGSNLQKDGHNDCKSKRKYKNIVKEREREKKMMGESNGHTEFRC
jgi:hypothetical protein